VRAHTRPRRRRSPTGVPLGMAWHSLHGLRALGGGRSASCLTNDGIAFRTFCSAVASLSLFLCLSVCVCVIRAGLVHVRVSIGRCQGRPPRGDTRLQQSTDPAQEGATASTATRLVYIFQAARSNQSLGTENSTRRRRKDREKPRKKHVKEYVITT
jgi:hypothetical protein